MKIGFTGTRKGTTCEQHHALCEYVKNLPDAAEWHHGCCVGADAESVEIVEQWSRRCEIIAHPPDNNAMVSRITLEFAKRVEPALPYLERNRAIVNACDTLVACPEGINEEQRSGTWSTVRFARKQKKRIVIVYPDGAITQENP